MDPEPLYASVLARLNEIASCERSALFLVDARDGTIRAHGHTGSWPEALLAMAWTRDQGLAQWIDIWQVDYLVLFHRMVPRLGLGKYVLASSGGRTLVDARAWAKTQAKAAPSTPPK